MVVLVTLGLLAASGYMIWHPPSGRDGQQQSAEYAAAGRQSVVTLMSLDFNKAEEDVKRIIDNSTGQFKKDFEEQARDFVKVAKESKVITEVTVNAVAVESMTKDTAVVLVAASSRVTNSAGAKQEPRTWRLQRGPSAGRRPDQDVESRVRTVTADRRRRRRQATSTTTARASTPKPPTPSRHRTDDADEATRGREGCEMTRRQPGPALTARAARQA